MCSGLVMRNLRKENKMAKTKVFFLSLQFSPTSPNPPIELGGHILMFLPFQLVP